MFDVFGINLHWYGLLIGIGVWIAMEIAIANRGKIKKEILEKSMLWTVIFGVIGARIYHVIDYWNRYYLNNIHKIFFLWEGGLGIWGAIGGGLLGLSIYCYFNKIKFVSILDKLVLGVPLAQAIGRIGNYINGELVGKNGEPIFAYEGGLNILLFGILWKMSQKEKSSGVLSGIYLIGYGVIRFTLENLRPEDTIWKIYNIPVAMIFGVVAIFSGCILIFLRKRS